MKTLWTLDCQDEDFDRWTCNYFLEKPKADHPALLGHVSPSDAEKLVAGEAVWEWDREVTYKLTERPLS